MLLGSTASGWERGRFNAGNFGDLPETNFILDGAGNLVRSLHVNYNERFVNPYTDATVTYSGGVASDHYANADLAIGRWTGGQMTVADNNGILSPLVNNLGGTSSYWFMTKAVPVNYASALIGTTTYTQVGATLPTDSLGNVGTLPVATLSANFTAQTVDASVAFTLASQGLTIANPAIPIVAGTEFFEGVIELGTAPTVSCSGTGCVAGYEGWLTGGFAGDTASNANLAYKIWPTAQANSLVSDLIQGVVAFNTGTAPTVGTAKAYTPNHVAVETAGQFGFGEWILANPADLVYVPGGTSTSGALTSMTVRAFGGGQNYVFTETISGGTATSADAPSFASTGIQYGAWTGYTGVSQSSSFTLDGISHGEPSRWMYGPVGYVDAAYWTGSAVTGPMAATFSYQLDGAPAPRSMNTGFDGVLNSAYITADFVTLLVDAGVDITMPGNENWVASMSGQPIDVNNGQFGQGSVAVSYGAGVAATTCATCGGNLDGSFTGQNYAGAILSYEMYSNFTNGGDQVQGNAAFTRIGVGGNTVVTDEMPTPTANTVVATDGWNGAAIYTTATTAGNVLTAYGWSGPGYSFNTTISGCTTCTATPSGQVGTSGIYYGTWDSGTYSSSWSNTFTAGTLSPSYWITGPESGPLYLPQALIGTASYSFDAGQVTNGMGVAGTVAGTTTLALDFTKQTVGINLDISIDDTATTPAVHTWNVATALGKEAALRNGMRTNGQAFYASTNDNGNGSGLLTVTVDSGATPATIYNADINGQLTGVGLNGAIMGFNLSGILNPGTAPTYESISGVAAFTGTAQDVATAHRYVGIAFYEPFAAVPQPLFGFYANNDARVTQDVSGNLTQFDMQIMSTNGGDGSMTFASNTATLTDHGTDAASGISWGRWAGGAFNATDRVTGIVTPVTNSGSLHWIAEPVATAATTLPLVGTYTYVNAGGTTPTDNTGVTGTLNSATLTADFTAHTVNMGVNVTVAGATLDAVANNAPIIQRTAFYASSQEPPTSTSHLAVTCSGGAACSTTVGGSVFGKFTGAEAIGAVMTYGLQNGNSAVSGVAAFHQ